MLRKTKKTVSKLAIPSSTRVAAYARVSSDKDAMLTSLSFQVSYYSSLIQNHPGWVFAGVYADEARTGTKENRPEFNRLIEDCRAGKIDLILVKSIARFSRNTVTLLSTVRELKSLGVEVLFESENIHTMSAEGELMLSLIAAIAQEESRSVSENCKWRIRQDFANGIPNGIKVLGYRLDNGNYQIIQDEATVVRMIFNDYLSGMGRTAIVKKMRELGAPTRFGGEWGVNTIFNILRNIMYVGDLTLQKTFITDHLTKTQVRNRGELPSYYVRDNHEPIIEREIFECVQVEIARRQQKHCGKNMRLERRVYPFTGLIVCGCCGKHYRRKITAAGTKYAKPVWICDTFNRLGKASCASKQIPESILGQVIVDVLGSDWHEHGTLSEQIERIMVSGPNSLTLQLADGQIIECEWQPPSRSECWDEAARARAREQAYARYTK